MNLDIKEVIMLEIPECVEVKIYENCHYLRTTHSPSTPSVFTAIRLGNGMLAYLRVIFLAKIINNTEHYCPRKSFNNLLKLL